MNHKGQVREKSISVEVIQNKDGFYDSAESTGVPDYVEDEIERSLSGKKTKMIMVAHLDVMSVLYDIAHDSNNDFEYKNANISLSSRPYPSRTEE